MRLQIDIGAKELLSPDIGSHRALILMGSKGHECSFFPQTA